MQSFFKNDSSIANINLDEIVANYFDNLPYFDEDENDNAYVKGGNEPKKNVLLTEDLDICIDECDQKENIKHKIKDLMSKFDDIKNIIEKSLVNWEFNRIGKAEMTIIILAVYEMYYDNDIDIKVAINEALELSKVYCDEKAVKFINGILSTIYKQENNKNI